MSLIKPVHADQAALQEHLRQLHESAVNGPDMTPMQALEQRIARGDFKAAQLKAIVQNYRSSAKTAGEKPSRINRAVTLRVTKITFKNKTL